MKYFDVDYAVLRALAGQNTQTAGSLLAEMGSLILWMASPEGLASSLAVLAADGYVTVEAEGNLLAADTRISLTEAGREAIAVGGLAKLFSNRRERAMRKNEARFCELPRPAVEPYVPDRASFAGWAKSAIPYDDEFRYLFIADAEDGLYSLSFCQDHAEADESDFSPAPPVICDVEGLRHILNDLLDTAILFTESSKPRKVLLSGMGRSYVMTVALVADEEGYSVMRVTAAPILFNHRRFVGKRDSDLDYAQCGGNVLSATLDTTNQWIAVTTCTVAARPDLLDEDLSDKIHTLYKLNQ